MKSIISINNSSEIVITKLNETVKSKSEITDMLGLTNFYFWGQKIEKNEFLWASVKHVNNFFRIKGKIVAKDNEQTELHLEVKNRPSYYVIYVLGILFLLVGLFSVEKFFAIFSVVFIMAGLIMKYNYFENVTQDIKEIWKEENIKN